MNADLMITIAFCLYVLLGSLAVGMLFAQSIRDDKVKRRRRSGALPAASPPTGSDSHGRRELEAGVPTAVSE
jgi:hypothetical protein